MAIFGNTDDETKKQLRIFLSKNFPHIKKGMEEFIALFEKKTFLKKEMLLTNGKVEKELKFVNEGYIREYYSDDQKEVNINFYSKGHFNTDFISFHTGLPTLKYQECLTNVELLVISKEKCDDLLGSFMGGHLLIETSFKRVLIANERREFLMIVNEPDVLYKKIMKNHPQWLLNIPQYHIASYLRIAPETLSRIRKRNA